MHLCFFNSSGPWGGGEQWHYETALLARDKGYQVSVVVNTQSVLADRLAGEQGVLKAGGRSLIFRSSWVFGARGNNFVKTILRLARERSSLQVVDDQIGCPTPAALMATVSGLVLGMVRHVRCASLLPPKIYHLAATGPVSWCGFAREILMLAEQTPGFKLMLQAEQISPVSSSEYPLPAKRPLNSQLNCQALEQDFGLVMPDWRPYLARMMQLLSLKQNGY